MAEAKLIETQDLFKVGGNPGLGPSVLLLAVCITGCYVGRRRCMVEAKAAIDPPCDFDSVASSHKEEATHRMPFPKTSAALDGSSMPWAPSPVLEEAGVRQAPSEEEESFALDLVCPSRVESSPLSKAGSARGALPPQQRNAVASPVRATVASHTPVKRAEASSSGPADQGSTSMPSPAPESLLHDAIVDGDLAIGLLPAGSHELAPLRRDCRSIAPGGANQCVANPSNGTDGPLVPGASRSVEEGSSKTSLSRRQGTGEQGASGPLAGDTTGSETGNAHEEHSDTGGVGHARIEGEEVSCDATKVTTPGISIAAAALAQRHKHKMRMAAAASSAAQRDAAAQEDGASTADPINTTEARPSSGAMKDMNNLLFARSSAFLQVAGKACKIGRAKANDIIVASQRGRPVQYDTLASGTLGLFILFSVHDTSQNS